MKVIILYVAGAIILASSIIYYFLGGFNPVIFKTDADSMTIYGQSFEGKYDDARLEEYFLEAKENTTTNKNNKLVVIDYFLDSKDSVKQFIGVISQDTSLALPTLKFKDVTFVKGTITCHPYVRPHPRSVREMAEEYAIDNSLKLNAFSIEFYDAKEEIEVWFPSKTN